MSDRGFFGIGLHHPRKKVNVGHCLRFAHAYGAAFVAVAKHPDEVLDCTKIATDTPRAWRHKPVFRVANLLDIVPIGTAIIGVEITDDAEPIETFTHPERAVYLFGPESGSLPRNVLDACDHVIVLPTRGSLNLAMALGTVLFHRALTRSQ